MIKTKNFFRQRRISLGLIIHLSIFLMLIVPVFSLAQGTPPSTGLVPCGKADASGVISKPCGFKDLMILVDKVIKFILYSMVIPIAAIMFAYAGFLLVTAGGGEAKTKAKNIFTNAVIGLIIAVAAFLIIKTILLILGYKDIGIFF